MPSAKSSVTEQRLNDLIARGGISNVDTVVPDVTVNGTNKALGVYTITGGSISGDGTEHFVGDACGTFTTPATAPTAAQFVVFMDGVGSGTIANFGFPAAWLANNLTGAGWSVHFDLYWTSLSRVVCDIKVWWHNASGGVGAVHSFTVQSLTGVDTSSDKDLTLAFQWTGNGNTLKTEAVHIRRVA